jgi:hypothetical protein
MSDASGQIMLTMDHKLNRHAALPNPECPKCNPDRVPLVFDEVDRRDRLFDGWDFTASTPPNSLPNFGATWMHGDTPKIFIPSEPLVEGRKPDHSGLWVNPLEIALLSIPVEGPISPLSMLKGSRQIELASGQWSPKVQESALSCIIPDESTLKSSPMGVDIVKWETEQNRAKLLVFLSNHRQFPLGTSATHSDMDHVHRRTRITETVRVIEVPVI